MIGKLFKSSDLSDPPSRKRATFLQALGGYVNTGIVIIQGLLLVPLYLHFIGAHMYGLWLASGGMLGMLGLMNFGISSLVIQRVARAYGQKDHAKAGAYFINGAVIYLGICLLYAMTGWVVSIWLPVILSMTGDGIVLLRQCFQLAVAAMAIGILNECLRGFCQALLRPVIPMVGMAIGRILGISVTVWMLFDDIGLWAIPAGTLMAESVIFILNLFYALALFKKLATGMFLDRNIIRDYMRTSPALLMGRVGDTASQEAEPLLITIFLSPEVTAAYMVTRRAADIVFRISSVIIGSTMGSFAHLVGKGDCEKTGRIARNLLVLSFSVSAIGFATYAGANHAFVTLWVGESYSLDFNTILFIGLGFFARSFRGLLSQMLYGLGSFVHTSFVILLEGLARIILAAGLLSMLGIIGAPLAFIVSCTLATVALSFRIEERLSIRFYLPTMVRFMLSAAVLFGISISLTQMDVDIDSWSDFTLFLAMLLASYLAVIISINWTRCCETYKSIAG